MLLLCLFLCMLLLCLFLCMLLLCLFLYIMFAVVADSCNSFDLSFLCFWKKTEMAS